MVSGVQIESCVDSLETAQAAIDAGADRLELCDFSAPDGVTPGIPLLESVLAASPIPVHVMVRPRGGNFVYSGEDDVALMVRAVLDARAAGAAGVALGALTAAHGVDQSLTALLVEKARPMAVTFHRGFDSTPDPEVALEVLVNLRVRRVLTSGHAADAQTGIPGLGRLVRAAGDRIGIIAAGSIRGHNVVRIVQETGVKEIHSRGDIGAIVRALKAG
jgi:copper homeostasis protein